MSSVITTDFERWKAQEAALGKPVALNEFVFANVPGLDPSKDISRDEKLPPAGQIVHRQAVNKAGLASENAVAYSVTLGTDVGDFVFNWIGLINKESGTLAMITHAPEQRKIKTVDGVQGNVLTRSFLLEFNGAAKETKITTSAETWQIDFTARLAGMDEIQRLANRDIYGVAAFFGDGFLVTKAAEQYRVTPGTAYIEGLRGTLEEITTFNNLRDTKIYADFTFQGNLVSKWQTFVKVTTAKTLAHYQDAAGFQHYVAVIAEIDQNGNITDKRVKGTATDRELAELKKDLPEKYQQKGDYQPAGSYQPAGNYVDSDYFRLEMLKKFDKANISDQMGNDGDKVPSLRLLSEQIEKCQPKGNYAANDGSGIAASEFRSHLQLGDAARRYVGNNPNDLPDMSFFKTVSGGFSLPQGTQFRFGVVSGDGYKSFGVPFPNECHTIVFGQMFGPNAWVFSAMYKNLTKSGFEFAARAYSGISGLQNAGESVAYLALGG
ncbi:phage tail protein [Morganella morganii]|uniref:phage tail protein n=1 Tax=Morganella morganii TaxID=582 RepID=UPI002231D451|nr:phage tail protein [Morganella morganii]MDM8751091.1 phage tail protein [Morganella morganii]